MIVYKVVRTVQGKMCSLNKGRARHFSDESERLMRTYTIGKWTSAPRVGHKVAPLFCFKTEEQARKL